MTLERRFKRFFFAIVSSLLLMASLQAQMNTFDLSGTVGDETGAVLPGVEITLTNSITGAVLKTVSNGVGRFLFASVPAGTFVLSAELEGFARARYEDLDFYGGTKPSLEITLKPSVAGEVVTVTEAVPLVNTNQAQIGQTVDNTQIEGLPLVGRDYLDLVTLVGGVSDVSNQIAGATVLGATSQSVNGTYSRYTAYQLDGYSNTRDIHGVVKVDLALDSIQEFRVITNQFSAEYGQSMGGVISAITRSGTNDFHGSAAIYHRPPSWSADDPLTGSETSFERTDFAGTFSGPLVKNRTHFFTSFEYRDQSEDAVVTAPIGGGMFQGVFPLKGKVKRFLGKVSQRINDNHNLEGKIILNDETIENNVGGLNIEANRRDNINDDKAGYVTWRSVLKDNIVNEFRFSYTDENYQSVAQQPPPFGAVLSYPGQGIIGDNNTRQSGDENGFEIGDNISFLLGSHSLKFGFDVFRIETIADLIVFDKGGYNFPAGAQFPYDPNNPATFPTTFQQGFFSNLPGGVTVLDRAENHYQFYVQDDWQISPNFTLNMGLRWEKESSVPDNNNYAPRIGFNWDPSGSRKTAVRGGVGVFYNYVFSSVEAFEIFTGPLGFFVAGFAADDPRLPAFPGALPGPVLPAGFQQPTGNWYLNSSVYSPDSRKNPYAVHYTLGLEQQLGQDWAFSADLTYIQGEALIIPQNLNAPTFFNYAGGARRSRAAADATRPYGVPGTVIASGVDPFLPGGYPFAGFRDLYLLRSFGTSDYTALKLRLNRRFADNVMFQVNYTFSDTSNNADDFRPGNSLPIRPGVYDETRSATDIPHIFTVNGIWDAPLGIQVSGILRANSGRPIDPRVGTDLDGDGLSRERPIFSDGRVLERNSFRAGSFTRLDLSLGKIFRIKDSVSIEGRMEIFNLTNELNPDSVNNIFGVDPTNPSANFLRVQSALPGRQFQLSAKLRF